MHKLLRQISGWRNRGEATPLSSFSSCHVRLISKFHSHYTYFHEKKKAPTIKAGASLSIFLELLLDYPVFIEHRPSLELDLLA